MMMITENDTSGPYYISYNETPFKASTHLKQYCVRIFHSDLYTYLPNLPRVLIFCHGLLLRVGENMTGKKPSPNRCWSELSAAFPDELFQRWFRYVFRPGQWECRLQNIIYAFAFNLFNIVFESVLIYIHNICNIGWSEISTMALDSPELRSVVLVYCVKFIYITNFIGEQRSQLQRRSYEMIWY